MKNKAYLLLVAVLMTAAAFFANSKVELSNDQNLSYLKIALNSAIAEDGGCTTSNCGPAKIDKCGFLGTKKRKWCMSEDAVNCTEVACGD